MAVNELHRKYPNRNNQLRALAKKCFEYGRNIASESSAALTNGLDEHALTRQNACLEEAVRMGAALNAKPIPDRPMTTINMDIDFSQPYVYFLEDIAGNKVPMNEDTQLLAEEWLITATELAKCDSAAIAGSLIDFDYARFEFNIGSISKLVEEIEEKPHLDLPRSADPGSEKAARSGGKSK